MEAKQLEFSYQEQPFIQNYNLKLKRGKITTIIGPNGSGKSTVLNLLANQLKPKSGQITINQTDIQEMKTKELARKLSVVYQQNHAPNDLTVRGLVEYGRIPYQGFFHSNDSEDEKMVQQALEATNLIHLSEKNLQQLSGGERQRAWIAMAIAQSTDILFLDEPTTYLDIYYQIELLEMVKRLNAEMNLTVVMVLHDINQAIQYSDEIVVMKRGSIIAQGAPEDIMTVEMLHEVYGINACIRWCPINQCQYMIPTKVNA